jgi:hypothetical protein
VACFTQDGQSGIEREREREKKREETSLPKTSPKNLDITEELRIRAFCDLGRTDFYP